MKAHGHALSYCLIELNSNQVFHFQNHLTQNTIILLGSKLLFLTQNRLNNKLLLHVSVIVLWLRLRTDGGCENVPEVIHEIMERSGLNWKHPEWMNERSLELISFLSLKHPIIPWKFGEKVQLLSTLLLWSWSFVLFLKKSLKHHKS